MGAESSKKKPRGRPFPKGVSGNPGGIPAGKRISTWMLELSALPLAELNRLEAKGDLPAGALIAIARIRKSLEDDGEKSTEIVLDRTEGKVPQPIEGNITETKRMLLVFPESE